MTPTPFAFANAPSWREADVVLIGVPDESGSTSERKGTAEAPGRMREVSQRRLVILRDKVPSLIQPQSRIFTRKVYDLGDIEKSLVEETIERILRDGKMPVTLGGDHSITIEILRGVSRVVDRVSLLYLDAHPDFICSKREYYGSVVCDLLDLPNIEIESSIEIGIRAPEAEEIRHLQERRLKSISSFDFLRLGVEGVLREVEEHVGKKNTVYLSIDMDIVDPAFAPGVETPAPGGLSSNEFLYLAREIAKRGILGLDLMEVNPRFDFQDQTSDLAVHTLLEVLSASQR
jgi:agmatinase